MSEEQKENGNVRNGRTIPTIFEAIKSGMLVPVQTLVDTHGPVILHGRDDKGHSPAHWACLGGHTTILRFIIEMKGPINEASDNDLGQRPIHWACVNGHIGIVDILLQWGVGIDCVDNKGCTPLIVACQYGQTMLSGYLIGKGANRESVDKDGDSPLHWAAFKGHNELMRLLVYSSFSADQKDNYGQTPLHLACINGNLTAVKELCEQDQVEINLPDRNGKTPLMLATGRKHEAVVSYLGSESKQRASLMPKFDVWSLIFGPPGKTKGPLLFFLINMFCWAYPMYIIKCLPETWEDLQSLHVFFWLLNVVMWISLYRCSTTNPGFLPRNTAAYDRAIKEVAHYDEWKQGHNPLSRLCHTCRTVKPLRSKHCRICNRCVKMFDHHCPYVYNCIGVQNRGSFFVFIMCLLASILFCTYLCVRHLRQISLSPFFVVGFIEAGFFSVIAFLVFIFTAYHMALNLTTNERINYKRYKYLQNARGKYHNPYDRGYKSNILEYFHLRRPLSEDKVEFLNITVI